MTATATGSYATSTAFKAVAGITSSEDDTLIGLICDRVNQYLESEMKQVVAPISSATYLYDGNGRTRLPLGVPVDASPRGIGGIRSVSLVEVASVTGADYETIASGDYFLRGRAGMTGPYRYLIFSDVPAGTYTAWPAGYATVRVTGTAGWDAIPDDLTNLALSVVQRAWNARQSGYQNITATDENGKPIVARFLELPDYRTLKRYTLRQEQVIT